MARLFSSPEWKSYAKQRDLDMKSNLLKRYAQGDKNLRKTFFGTIATKKRYMHIASAESPRFAYTDLPLPKDLNRTHVGSANIVAEQAYNRRLKIGLAAGAVLATLGVGAATYEPVFLDKPVEELTFEDNKSDMVLTQGDSVGAIAVLLGSGVSGLAGISLIARRRNTE